MGGKRRGELYAEMEREAAEEIVESGEIRWEIMRLERETQEFRRQFFQRVLTRSRKAA